MKYCPAIILLFFCCCAVKVTAQVKDSLVYRFVAPDYLSSQWLTLYENGIFYYRTAACLSSFYSDGHWHYEKDTLILESSFREGEIPIAVQESEDGSPDSMTLSVVKNPEGEDSGGAYLVNSDTARWIWGDMMFEKVQPGSIDSFRIIYDSRNCSKWYTVKNKRTNKLTVTVQHSNPMYNYISFNNRKYLRRGKSLLSLNEESGYYVRGEFKMIPVLLKPIKPGEEK